MRREYIGEVSYLIMSIYMVALRVVYWVAMIALVANINGYDTTKGPIPIMVSSLKPSIAKLRNEVYSVLSYYPGIEPRCKLLPGVV